MNRPEALNALNIETLEEIVTVMKRIENDDSVKGVILASEGRAFIAGADITEFKVFTATEGRKASQRGQSACKRLRTWWRL